MRPRIPLAYAGLLIIALVAVVGFAAFSPSSEPEKPEDVATVEEDTTPPAEASARVASAVLALRVSDAESRTATTNAAAESTTTSSASSEATTTTSAATEDTTATPDTAAAAAPDPTTSSTATPQATPQKDTTPPSIKVTSHDDGDTVSNRIVSFIGTTEPGASVASGPYEADVSDNGEWELSLVMAPGPNGAHFTATDDAGNTASTRIVLTYEPPTAATTTTKANTTTTSGSSGTTTTTSGGSSWSPNWPADSGGRRDVESWRSTVANYWPANRVDCVLGIIKRESGGDPRAYNSSSKAEGLMQHLSKYWESRAIGAGFVDGNGKVATPYNGAANIAAGAYLAGWAQNYQSAWWWPWKSSGGVFTAQYGSCTSSNPS